MKKVHGNALVFILSLFFLGIGLLGGCLPGIRNLKEEIRDGSIRDAEAFTDRVDTIAEEKLRYHNLLLTINSVKENLLGTRVVEKPDTLVVKTESGKLTGYIQTAPTTEEEAEELVRYTSNIRQIAENNGADFLCCLIPVKGVFEATPANVKDYCRENNDRSREILTEAGIPLLDLRSAFKEKGIPDEELFFITDHHWKPSTGFAAYQAICEELQERYGFAYNKDHADLGNFDIRTYPNQFLGSLGKKVGLYFTWEGADDFDLITPEFPTSFREEVPQLERVREGSFQESLLFPENLEKNYYGKNTFVTYSGGDYRLEIIRNRLNPEGPRVAVIRTSFACVVTPFLALQAGELYVIDDREGDYPAGDPVNLEELFEEIHPDVVLLLKQL